MNINPTATQPNFTARVKKNDFMQNYIKESSQDRLNDLTNSLKALKKVYPKDVLEITPNKRGGFDVKNEAKKVNTSFSPEPDFVHMQDYSIDCTVPLKLPELIAKIATKGTSEHDTVFNVKPKASKEEKAHQNALNMLA